MRKSMIAGIVIISVCMLLLPGCSKSPKITKLTSIWKYEPYSKGRLDKVMVVGKPNIEKNRILFEDHFSKKLTKRGVKTVSSYNVIPELVQLNKASIKQAALDSKAGAVIATRVVSVEDKSLVIPQRTTVDIYDTGTGLIMMGPFIEGPYVKEYKKVRLETGLFDTDSEKLLWAAKSRILDPKSVKDAIADFSLAVIQQLQSDGYVK